MCARWMKTCVLAVYRHVCLLDLARYRYKHVCMPDTDMCLLAGYRYIHLCLLDTDTCLLAGYKHMCLCIRIQTCVLAGYRHVLACWIDTVAGQNIQLVNMSGSGIQYLW